MCSKELPSPCLCHNVHRDGWKLKPRKANGQEGPPLAGVDLLDASKRSNKGRNKMIPD
jgi:hypothetical protein